MANAINPQIPGVFVDTYTPDSLIAGFNVAPVTDAVTLASGQNLARGALVGMVSGGATSGQVVLSVSGATDGSQHPYGVLAAATNATSAAQLAPIYLTGEFNVSAMTIDASWSSPSVLAAALRLVNIYLKTLPPGF